MLRPWCCCAWSLAYLFKLVRWWVTAAAKNGHATGLEVTSSRVPVLGAVTISFIKLWVINQPLEFSVVTLVLNSSYKPALTISHTIVIKCYRHYRPPTCDPSSSFLLCRASLGWDVIDRVVANIQCGEWFRAHAVKVIGASIPSGASNLCWLICGELIWINYAACQS